MLISPKFLQVKKEDSWLNLISSFFNCWSIFLLILFMFFGCIKIHDFLHCFFFHGYQCLYPVNFSFWAIIFIFSTNLGIEMRLFVMSVRIICDFWLLYLTTKLGLEMRLFVIIVIIICDFWLLNFIWWLFPSNGIFLLCHDDVLIWII